MTAVDPSRCPLCGEPNRCAMEVARKTGSPVDVCWCMSAEFLPGVLDKVPAPARGVACVCAFCAAGAPVPAPDPQISSGSAAPAARADPGSGSASR